MIDFEPRVMTLEVKVKSTTPIERKPTLLLTEPVVPSSTPKMRK